MLLPKNLDRINEQRKLGANMPSIIRGFEYDIFISYRHNDNLDGWVTDFVQNLEKELKATIKEPLSIYFDKNPHDGILETHHVDKSLQGKLKCLIFIPILSQTYCDPKSFAWQYEFCAFNNLAQDEPFGRDIKLANGNVASRILPIKIHDLDVEDKDIIEKEIGGVLRGVEFIFRSTGVNRPLCAKDDEIREIAHAVFYKDQINKVAYAVKEMIRSLQSPAKILDTRTLPEKPLPSTSKRSAIIAAGILSLGILAFIIFYFSGFTREVRGKKNSIAVLPFKNFSAKPETQYFADGVMEAVLNHLSKIKDLKVISRTSMEPYRETKKTLREIAKEVDVNHVLEGSVQRDGDKVRVTVQLIDPSTDDHIWAGDFTEDFKTLFEIQSSIAQNVARNLEITLQSKEKKLIEKIPTRNLNAYDDYLKGKEKVYRYLRYRKEADYVSAINYLKKALTQDSLLAPAYTEYARAFYRYHYLRDFFKEDFQDTTLLLANKALTIDPDLADAHIIRGLYYADVKSAFDEAKKELENAIELNPNQAVGYLAFGQAFSSYDPALAFELLLKGIRVDPNSPEKSSILQMISWTYLAAGMFDKAELYGRKAVEASPEAPGMLATLAHVYMVQGKITQALDVCEKWEKLSPSAHRYLQEAYVLLGDLEKAEKHMKEYEKNYANDFNYRQRYGVLLWKLGRKKEAMEKFNEALNDYERMFRLGRETRNYIIYDLAGVNAIIGRKEEAYRWIQKWGEHGLSIGLDRYAVIDPFFETIRNNPAFKHAIEKQKKIHEELAKKILEIESRYGQP